MKRTILIAFTTCLACWALPSLAQKPGKIFSAGFGIEGGVPVANASNYYGGYGGVTARFAFHAGPGFITFTTGGIIFGPKNVENDNVKISAQIPLKAGYKYVIVGHLFVMGEVGYSVIRTYYDDNYSESVSYTSTGGFTFAPAVGVQFGVMEASLRYESTSVSGGNFSYFGARLGFNF